MFAYWNNAYLLIIGLEIICVVHAYRTGRREWIYLLVFLPMIGIGIYFFSQILPEISRGDFLQNLQRIFFPRARITDMEKRLRMSDSVTNRLLLSDAYAEQGRYADAIDLVKSCMTDLYASDQDLILRMARLSFLNGQYAVSMDYFSRGLFQDNRGMNRMEDELLYARAVEGSGDLEKADAMYVKTIRKHQSLEARYRYGLMLKQQGRMPEAREQFETVRDEIDLYPRYARKIYRRWALLSRIELSKLTH